MFPKSCAKIEDIQKTQDLPLQEDLEPAVIYAGTNNLITDTPQIVFDKLIKLKLCIKALHEGVESFIITKLHLQ